MNNQKQKEFFQQCLFSALLQLMERKEFDKITIEELCQVAGVSRMTYYRSYHAREDILRQHLEELDSEFEGIVSRMEEITFRGIFLAFFQFISGRHREFYVQMVKSGKEDLLFDALYTDMDKILKIALPAMEPLPYLHSFKSGGIHRVLVDWIKNDMEPSAEYMADLLCHFFMIPHKMQLK